MTDDPIKLTAEEWKLVQEQCKDCCFWDDREGCSFPEAGFAEPTKDCLVKEEL